MGIFSSKQKKETGETKNNKNSLENEVKDLKEQIKKQGEAIKENEQKTGAQGIIINNNSNDISKIKETLEKHEVRLDRNDKLLETLVGLSAKSDKRLVAAENTLNNSISMLDMHRKMLCPSENELKTPLRSNRQQQTEILNLENKNESLNQDAPIPAMIADNNLNDKSNEL